MCGIAGFIGNKIIEPPVVSRTLALMYNRGPDSRKSMSIEEETYRVYLLHTRLNIIDLRERSNQPFVIGDYTLIYNGEVYNYLEVRSELENHGIQFHTTSDTEVVLRAYMFYGEKCVEQFEGMWSFAIYDRRLRKLFLSRDRFGEKPLYIMNTPEGVYFGSQIKYLSSLSNKKLQVNYDHIYRFLVNGYKSLYKTSEEFFQGVHLLPRATNMIIDGDLNSKSVVYWNPDVSVTPMSISDAVEGTRERLLESVRIRLRADVPLAFCLSGGVDSAAIVSIAAKKFHSDVTTFSIIDQDERYNEYDNIMATVNDLKCNHILVDLKQENTFAHLTDLISYHDSPVSTISYLVHSYLSEAISGHGFKIAFSGTSADELFTGYYDHFIAHLFEMKDHPQYGKYLHDWQENIATFVRNPHLKNPQLYIQDREFREHIYFRNSEFASFLNVDFKENFHETHYSNSLLRNRMLNELFEEGTPVILHEDDLNSMRYSIENRSPYLDSRLFGFAYSIPAEHLIQNGYGKFVLREALDGILNNTVRLDRRKKGFNASLNSVVDFDKPEDRAAVLDDSKIYEYIKKDKIEEMIKEKPLSNSSSKFLFNFINVKLFVEMNS